MGPWAGANGGSYDLGYQPDMTSYDYTAPLSEGGHHNFGSDGVDKFASIQAVLLGMQLIPILLSIVPTLYIGSGPVYRVISTTYRPQTSKTVGSDT